MAAEPASRGREPSRRSGLAAPPGRDVPDRGAKHEHERKQSELAREPYSPREPGAGVSVAHVARALERNGEGEEVTRGEQGDGGEHEQGNREALHVSAFGRYRRQPA
jgi:hypothetical protein